MPTHFPITVLLLVFLSSAAAADAATVRRRRVLHEPFFPQDSFPPPTPNNQPFFPSYTTHPPPHPPPPPALISTLPANVSSNDANPKSASSKLIGGAVAAVVVAVAIVSVVVFLHLHRRSRKNPRPTASFGHSKSHRSDTNSSATTFHQPPHDNHHRHHQVPELRRPSQTSSEFLYLGTLVNSHAGIGGTIASANVGNASNQRKMDSPELHPLPPLRQNYRNNADLASSKGDDEDEEFYSPKGSTNSSIGTGSASKRAFAAIEVENFKAYTSNSSSTCSSSATVSRSRSPARSISLSLSPANSLSSGHSIPKSPDLIEIQTMGPLRLQISPSALPPNSLSQESESLSPPSSSSPYGYSRRSEESISPAISNGSNQKMESPVIISSSAPPPPPPPPPPPLPLSLSKVRETPKTRTPPPISPAISNGSNQKMESPVIISSSAPPPPPPPPPLPLSLSKVRETPKTRTPPPPPGKIPVSERLPTLVTSLRPTVISSFELPKNDSESVVEKDGDSGEHEDSTTKTKLKPLHWDKVRASSDREMVWDQLKCSSFKLNEDMIETLFVANAPKPSPKEATRWHVLPSPGQDNGIRVLDPKKAQNIAILLRALNVTVEEVCEGLLEGNTETLGTDLLESLLKMAPTKEEERKLKEYKDISPVKLGAAERFLKAVIDIPYAFKRLDAMLYASNFESEVDYLKKSFATLEAACEELRTSRMFLKLLEAVLKTGNRMNVGTNRGDAHAFKLDTLLKLADVKGADGRTTLLHFVVQEIIRSEGAHLTNRNTTDDSAVNDDAKCRKLGLQIVSKLSLELSNVKKAAAMDAEVLSGDVSKLSKGIGNIGEVARLNETMPLEESSSCRNFSESMNSFMKKAEEEIIRIQAQESVALSLVKEITEYFHGNSAREEAHPFRIFMVVRDFLTVLDRVCKEVGMINERTLVSSAYYKFPIPVNPMLQQATGGFSNAPQYNSSNKNH